MNQLEKVIPVPRPEKPEVANEPVKNQKLNAGVWVGIIMFLFAGIFFWQSFSLDYYGDFGPGPGFLPRWLAGFMVLLSALYIIDSLRKESIDIREAMPKGQGLKKVKAIFQSLIIFLVIVPFTGYVIASVAMLFILFFREYKWYWALALSFLVTSSLFLVFSFLLHVPLPENPFGL